MISLSKSVRKPGAIPAVSLGPSGSDGDTWPEPRANRWLAVASAIFVVNCMFVNAVQAQVLSPLDKDFDGKSWEEQKTQLPPYPKDSNLKQIDIGPVTSFRFFVDTESIDVGADGVVRFTLVARSDRGASNVSFEGLRCKTQEKKIYAVGRADETWVAARNPGWTGIGRPQVNPAHAVLFEDFFCPERIIVSGTPEAVDAIKYGGHARGRARR